MLKPLAKRIISCFLGLPILPGQQEKWTSASAAYFRSLKGIHKGHRGFVIGNGPSLRRQDLSALERDITIASNKIYLAFELVA